MTSVIPEASTATPNPQDQRGSVADVMADLVPTPGTDLHTLAVEHRLRLLVWTPADIDENPIDGLLAYFLERKDGKRFIILPAGQDTEVSVKAIRDLLAHQAVTA